MGEERARRAATRNAANPTGASVAPDGILELVERFERNIETYKASGYNETQLRREFLDTFFSLLGWDVDNKQGWAEAYKEVIHEDQIRVAGVAHAPDYCFRLGGSRKFFVEAKRPVVYVKDAIEPAYQLRRYAWSAKLPLSIVTDFEEFAIYDCRTKPQMSDKASVGRVVYMTFREYATRWTEISSVFSRDAVLRGSFDRYAADARSKRGTTEVDDAFLAEMEGWRLTLARNLALRNPTLNERDLNFAVQRIIDRIAFLRIAEDRGVEVFGQLKNAAEGKNVYARLCDRFRKADEKYNSGLFHFAAERGREEFPDLLTLTLNIDDGPLRDILDSLYYPRCPYVFSEIPADILGQVYERFLGKVIRLTAGHRAQVEERPEVRKAGGVYYTPTNVVGHIVKSTLGRLLESSTPSAVAKLRVLDPACGSGSFLLEAYQVLLDWHRSWYVADGAEKWARRKRPVLFQNVHGAWELTTAQRKEILLNNIYGVDIDSQAIEVTKLSLLLKVLEGETEESINANLKLFHDRALPDLGRNIRCGNSLVASDFHSGSMSDNDQVAPFDWQKAFPSIFAAGGFDAVIGNPPYLSFGGRQAVDLLPELRAYFEAHYDSAGWPTAHTLFMERAARLLAKRFVSFIVPDQVGHLDGYRSIREVVQRASKVREVRYWGEHVFRGVTTPALTFVLDRDHRGPTSICEKNASEASLALADGEVWGGALSRTLLKKLAERSFSVKPFVADCGVRTTAAADQVVPLADAKGEFVPTLEGKQVGRYWCSPPEVAVRLDTRHDLFKSKDAKYEGSKFVIRQTAAYPIVAPHEHTKYFRNSLHGLSEPGNGLDIRYIVGLLNSKVMRFAYVELVREASQRTFPQVKLGALARLPLRSVDMSVAAEKARYQLIVELVEEMLSLQRKLARERNPQVAERLRQHTEALDDRIDRAVFDHYGLDETEIGCIENVVRTLVKPPTVPAPREPVAGIARPPLAKSREADAKRPKPERRSARKLAR